MRTIIKGGMLVYGGGMKQEDVLIDHGKIIEIKSQIRPRGEDRIRDAADCFVLPGFISTGPGNQKPDVKYGVTTWVKATSLTLKDSEVWTEERNPFLISEENDFVYQVSLSECTKELLHMINRNRVKVIELEQSLEQLDWDLWQPRLERMGMVLKLKDNQIRQLPSFLSLPVMIPFGRGRRGSKHRTVVQVKADHYGNWQRWMRKVDPFVISSHWLDIQECVIPKLGKDQDIHHLLMMLVKSRASTPAKVFGIYPKKGSLHIGADADILLVPKDQFGSHAEGLFTPSAVAVKGKWIGEDEDLVKGQYVRANQTYAFSY